MIFINKFPPPILPQMEDDNMITQDELEINNAIDIVVDEYNNVAKGDTIRCFFNSENIGYALIKNPLEDFPIFFQKDATMLPDGTYPVYITAKDLAQNESTSDIVYAILKRDGVASLPAPIFIDEYDGYLSYDTIIIKNGTTIMVPNYEGIAVGDNVLVNFYVKNLQSEIIPESQYSFNYTVSDNDIMDGMLYLIPKEYILIVEEGSAHLAYNVTFAETGKESISPTTSVLLFSDLTSWSRNLLGSTGYLSSESNVIQRCYVKYESKNNTLPFADVLFNITGNNYFTSNGKKEITIRSDINGVSIAHISGSDINQNIISASITNNNEEYMLGFKLSNMHNNSEPYLTLNSTESDNSLTLNVENQPGYFTIIPNESTILTYDGVEYDKIANIHVSPTSPFYFYAKSLSGEKIVINITSVEELEVYCSMVF